MQFTAFVFIALPSFALEFLFKYYISKYKTCVTRPQYNINFGDH